MEENSYLKKIRNYVRPSYGLLAYLNYSLQERTFKKKEKIQVSDQYCSVLLFIRTGTLRLFAVKDEEETTILFWQANQFLVPIASVVNYIKGEIFIEFLEDSILIGYNDKHTANLYKLFVEFRELMSKVYQHQFAEVVLHATALARLNATDRFNQLMLTSPELFNRCELKIIAGYLGIHPKVLSRLRSKAVRR